MQLLTSNFNKPTFKAHTYKMGTKHLYEIRTDNEPYLGNEPILQEAGADCNDYYDNPMEKCGNLYLTETIDDINKYRIYYNDTCKIDNKNGKDYEIDCKKMRKTATLALRNQYRQPLVHALTKGKTVGKVISAEKYNGNISDISEPFILVTPDRLNIENPNMVGYIFTADNYMDFTFGGFQTRNDVDACAFIYDPKVIERLEKLHGEKIELEVKDDFIRFNKTDKTSKQKTFPKVEIPKLKPCNKILTSKEFSSDVIGLKAVNLRRLEELKEQGKLDVIIPKTVGLPHGYIQKLLDNNPELEQTYQQNKDSCICKYNARAKYSGEYAEKSMNELRKFLKENGITSDFIMLRSAFSGDNIPEYPSERLYDSVSVSLDSPTEDKNNRKLYNCILNNISRSKWSINPILSREKYQIPEENIQVGIILQDFIEDASHLRIHTNTDNGKLKIELFTGNCPSMERDYTEPHIFSYDKKSGELSYDSMQMLAPCVILNEDGQVIENEPIEEDLSNNKEIFEQLKKVAQNALVVEKEFGCPQIIEGGIKDDDIYFWQTQNIAKDNK